MNDNGKMLSSGDVAGLFGVSPKTVLVWVKKQYIPAVRTPGGHYRFSESDVNALMKRGIVSRAAR